MKKTVPLKKEIVFSNNLAEITAIALEHELREEFGVVVGNLIVSGSYKMNDISVNVEEFKEVIKVNIELSDNYLLDDLKMDIEDFYYEIIDSKVLSVNIEIGLDGLKEKPLPIPDVVNEIDNRVEIEKIKFDEKEDLVINDRCIEDEEIIRSIEPSEVKTLFDSFDESVETYSTYKVYLVKESDTIEGICLNYGVTMEILEPYNDLSDVKFMDKIIIPSIISDKN